MRSKTERLGKSESSERALKPCFFALFVLSTLAKYTLGGERQATKNIKKSRLEGILVLREQIFADAR